MNFIIFYPANNNDAKSEPLTPTHFNKRRSKNMFTIRFISDTICRSQNASNIKGVLNIYYEKRIR